MKTKNFIRFIVADNGQGKIASVNRITKVYDDDNNFIEIQSPYIFATGTQINVDIQDGNKNNYIPFRHFKHMNGDIVKRSKTEIINIDNAYKLKKQQKKTDIQNKKTAIINQRNIASDKNKTDKERIDAISKLIELKAL